MRIVATIWNFVIRQRFSDWILTSGFWDNEGVWKADGVWNFDPTGIVRNFNRFKIEQENDFHFKVVPSTYWILKEGFWDDEGIWVDSEIWKDS